MDVLQPAGKQNASSESRLRALNLEFLYTHHICACLGTQEACNWVICIITGIGRMYEWISRQGFKGRSHV